MIVLFETFFQNFLHHSLCIKKSFPNGLSFYLRCLWEIQRKNDLYIDSFFNKFSFKEKIYFRKWWEWRELCPCHSIRLLLVFVITENQKGTIFYLKKDCLCLTLYRFICIRYESCWLCNSMYHVRLVHV